MWHVDTPAARAHLMDPSYRKGWLVFEREDGTDRRRLRQVPDDWASLPPERLAQLCAVAAPVVAGRSRRPGSRPLLETARARIGARSAEPLTARGAA